MTDRGTHSQEMDKEVQHSKTQAIALALRGIGQRTLHRSSDRLSDAQAGLFARMRDEGAKICVIGPPGKTRSDDAALSAFLSARLARGRETARTPDFLRMPRVARATAVRSMVGGHLTLVASHSDGAHQFYGLSELGIALLAKHQSAKKLRISPRQ